MKKIQKTSLFWAYLLVGIITLLAGVIFLPVWIGKGLFFSNWGTTVLNYIIAAVVLIYTFMYLLPRMKNYRGSFIKVFLIVEMVVMVLIALGAISLGVGIIKIGNACQILGLAIWARGVIATLCGFYNVREAGHRYPSYKAIIAILFVTLGTYLFAKPIFTNVDMLWVASIILMLAGISLVVYGISAKPKAKKKQNNRYCSA